MPQFLKPVGTDGVQQRVNRATLRAQSIVLPAHSVDLDGKVTVFDKIQKELRRCNSVDAKEMLAVGVAVLMPACDVRRRSGAAAVVVVDPAALAYREKHGNKETAEVVPVFKGASDTADLEVEVETIDGKEVLSQGEGAPIIAQIGQDLDPERADWLPFSINDLRSLAASAGLSEASKLKKDELISLLIEKKVKPQPVES